MKLFNKLIKLSIKNKFISATIAILLILTGIYCLKALDIEAYPDFTNPIVQVITQMPGKSAEEVERLATIPLEKNLNGIPNEQKLYSSSLFGLSVIKVVFADGLPSSLIRQQVLERIYQTELPDGVKPVLGPDASAIGEIYRYTIESDYYNPMTLKAIEDWQMEKVFKQVPGIIEVNSFGGPVKTYKVILNHEKVRFYNLDVGEIFDAIKASNSTGGGHYISKNDQAYIVRGLGLYSDIESIENTVITSRNGIPIRVKDVGIVAIEPAVRIGQVGKNLDNDVVEGIVLMRKGENPTKTIKNLQNKLPDIKAQLPKGVHLKPFYERSELIHNTMHTIGHNVICGIVFVIIVLFAFILDLRITLIASLVIPLALGFAFTLFKIFDIPANLLSMGAVDFGIIVDGAVILMENIFRCLTEYKWQLTQTKKEAIIYKAVKEVGNVITFSTIIILCCFLPILAFDGVAGKLFHPLAFTMGFSLIGAVITSLFFLPAISAIYMPVKNIQEKDNKILDKITNIYRKFLNKILEELPKEFLSLVGGMFVVALTLFCFIGSEFLPNLDEGNIWLRVTVLPRSTTIEHSVEVAREIREILLQYPEVKNVISHIGSADDGTDPNLLSNIENMVDLKLAKDWRWKWHKNKQKLIQDMSEKLSDIPGITTYFTQYIQDNVEEAVSGSKGQVVVKIYGSDLYELQKLQDQTLAVLSNVKGIVDLSYDQIIGQPQYQIKIDRVKASRYGLRSDDIQKVVEIAIGGKNATQVLENEKRFDVFLRLEAKDRNSYRKIQNIIVKTPEGISVPLSNVTDISTDNGAMIITRSENSRVAIVRFNIRGRDLGSTVKDAQKELDKKLQLPDEYRIKWAGQSESQKSANTRLAIILPITLILIGVILHLNYKSKRLVLIAMSPILVTLSGCIFALFVTRTYFSISAGVGFIAAIGVSIQNGVILLSSIIRQNKLNTNLISAIEKGAIQKLRPVLTASLVAILGLLPAALSNGIGAQSQKPFAIAIIGGLSVGTFFTIFLIPLLYKITKEIKHENS
ncbi:TPA: CusA/CzcA family heavy metal efflux RND transporter [Candidatus Gastranaerophilales bacterium HUM_2]|nr:MAG TPA: CusA/CzcA family heavy metal efflux RND transporter [Candidatus Gastranaerophilales bacterium HUM_2]